MSMSRGCCRRSLPGGGVAHGLTAILAVVLASPIGQAQGRRDWIGEAQRKVVKVYGAGGLKGMEAYQSGVLVSPAGHVVTALSYVLDTDEIAVVVDDGRKFAAEMVGSDPIRELAVLKIPLEQQRWPYFDLEEAAAADIGDRVLALSNLFGIAVGDEPVSALQGVVSAIAPLNGRRGAFRANYAGDVYVIDAHANNPGAAGGALVDWQGRLLGLLGKELKSRVTGAWLHYAIPVDQFADVVADLVAGRGLTRSEVDLPQPEEPLSADDLGIVMTPDLLPRTPPYIDGVRPGSAAAGAGLKPDDLIVFVAGEPTASCSAVRDALARRESYEEIRISLLRDGQLVEATLAAQQATSRHDQGRHDQGHDITNNQTLDDRSESNPAAR